MFKTIMMMARVAAIVGFSAIPASLSASAAVEKRTEVGHAGYSVIAASGFQKGEHKGETILVNPDLDSSLVVRGLKVKRISDLDRGNLVLHFTKSKKYKLLSFRDFSFGGYQGIIFETNDVTTSTTYRTWFLFFGDRKGTGLATLNLALGNHNDQAESVALTMLKTLKRMSN